MLFKQAPAGLCGVLTAAMQRSLAEASVYV